MTDTAADIIKVTHALTRVLLQKNEAYGDSANNPVRIFSKADAGTGIKLRIDDKLARITNSDTLRQNDVCDLMGYLVLLCVENGWVDYHPDEVMTLAEYAESEENDGAEPSNPASEFWRKNVHAY